jgi:flagellar motor protein MotB
MPPAGTLIINQAVSDYTDGISLQQTLSNAVSNRVLPVYQIGLTPPGTVASPAFSLAGAGGDTVYCAFDLTNTGNDRDSVAVSYAVVPPSNTTIADVIFFDDANGDGRYDPGEEDPSFLAIDAGGSARMDAAVVLPAGNFGGSAFVDVRAVSTTDPNPTVQSSVFLVTNTSPPQMTLYLGPRGNAQALPGGEGSGDDLSEGYLDYTATTFTFENDVLNESLGADFYEISLADSIAQRLPPGVTVWFADSIGQRLPQSPTQTTRYLLGIVGPGQILPVQLRISSVSGPLSRVLDQPLDLGIWARSSVDTLQQNATVDRLIPPQEINPAAALSIDQAFHEQVAAVGDVVTLLVTAQNITDSLRVDNVVIDEYAQPQLDFITSPDFTLENGRLVWRAGALAGGESKTAVIKFAANARVTAGVAKAIGNVSGLAETGDQVWAGPAVSAVRLENDVFAKKGVVLGEVYVDENDNRRRDAGEPGVREVAVFLDSGEYAVTDSLGRFSIPRAFAGWRSVRLDEGSIPSGYEFFEPLTSRDVGRRANETLIHLLPGGNANVSFRLKRLPPPTVDVDHAVTYQEQVSVARFARLYKAFFIPSSHFGMARAKLTIDSAEQLRPVVEFLHEHPDWGVYVEGHTDSIPINTKEYPSNRRLSFARAEAIRGHLTSMGVDYDRTVVFGHGDTRPLTSNETVEGRRLNRRVEVSLIPPGVRLEDGELRRVSATVKNLSALPDTFKVNVRWAIATTSERPCDAVFRVNLPHQIRTAKVRVTMDGETVLPKEGEYVLPGFARSRAARCEIELRAANGDTSFVRGIEAVIEVDAPARREFRIRPYQNGRGAAGAGSYDLFTWREKVSASLARTGAGENGPEQNDPAQNGAIEPQVDAGSNGPGENGSASVPDFGRGRSGRQHDTSGPTMGILDPQPDQVFSRADQIKIRARVPLGGNTSVMIGGEPLAKGHMGQKAVHVNEGFEEITWYAVRIRPGWNTIAVKTSRLDGTVEADSVRVALASRPAGIEAQRRRILVPADGRTAEVVRFAVRDEQGLPASDGFVATVTQGDSIVANPDVRPGSPGLQVASTAGFYTLQIKPGKDTRVRAVEIECDGMVAICDVSYVSSVRPAMATGVLDLTLGSWDTGGNGDPEGLQNYEDGFAADADARLFLQSALPHGVGVTARLDTEKRDEDPHLKQINPDRQYPIYGDESELRFAAPSHNGNYVSVDKGESFLRYGDFRTPFTNGQYLYYHQVATGVTGSLVGRDGAVTGFVTDTDYATYRDELRADGTSGFYYLNHTPVVLNTERLFLETRDRFQSEIIIDLKPLVRNRDYTVNPFDGSILFKEPVHAFDRDLNPVYIIAVYEVETGEDSQYLFGMRGDLLRDRRYSVGATAVSNSGDGARYALYGMDGAVDVSGVTLGAEFARSENDVLGNGNAYRLEAGLNNGRTNSSIYFRRVDNEFDNPSFLLGAQELGTRKAGFKSRVFMWQELSLYADGWLHKLRRADEEKSSLLAGADYRHRRFQLFVGGRYAQENPMAEDDQTGLLSVLGLATDIPRKLEFRTRWEKNLGNEWVQEFPDRLTTLLAVPFGQRLRVTASHEYATAPGRPGTNQFLAGVESRLAPRTTVYTRYSMNRTASDERIGAVAGLRQMFRLRYDVSGTLALEGFQSMADDDDDEYLTVKTGLAKRKPDSYVVETRYEYRWQTVRSKHNFQVVASKQLRRGFSLLLNDVLSYTPDQERRNGLNYRGKLGLAYRPVGLPVQTLFTLKNLYEKYTPALPDAIGWRLVLSCDVNALPAVDHEVRLKYAYKRVEDYSYGIGVDTNVDLILGQYIYRFAGSWDVDVWGRVLAMRHGTTETGAGVEVGRLFYRTLRVAAGYSYNGFEDRDISGTDVWARGFSVRFQLILSDWIMNEFGGL